MEVPDVIYYPINAYSPCFQHFATINNTAMNTLVLHAYILLLFQWDTSLLIE